MRNGTPLLGADTPNYSRLVYPGKDGRLAYTPDERGNRIPDFSLCGYRGGGEPLPDVPVRAELSPDVRRCHRARSGRPRSRLGNAPR